MANSKTDTNRNSYKTSLSLTDAGSVFMTNTDLERRVLGATLTLTGSALASKSINDLRVMNSQRARDYS